MLTILAIRVKSQKYLSRLWKPSGGLLSVFGFCIKVKPFSNLAEAHAMQFVAQHTSSPKMDGEIAASGWLSRTEESKRRILDQLRSMVSELRTIQPPEGMGVANVNGGPFYDCRLASKLLWGPFSTVCEFHRALANEPDLDANFEKLPPDLVELLTYYKRPCNTLVFTHGDLSSLNILVRGDDVVGIIDWETSGWSPSYWEYTCAWNVNSYNPFWQQEVGRFLTPAPHELRMDSIRRKYFPPF
ncbi:kinase-like domain-containing protein [Phialemonium atrogriseum]|uniref:Kinase-like domain-containing protein n=1 Tax=Phialemonium atrogriseum TaxID=1093897 RepID=A0AAJ0BX72_9PEZI|nr:kinase-like domain-containing protein [Phialemonium atrogriseum]KAK1765512.1 kinase-like domain-containing protein [Phialemonium atrogriseum]